MPQRLAQHLIARGLLPAHLVDEALKRLTQRGGTLDTALLELGAISEAGMLQAVSDVSTVRLVNLADFEPNTDAGPLMPLKMARQLNVVPLSLDGNALHIASAYPIASSQLKDLGFLLGRKVELWVALECRIKDWQSVLYREPLDERYERLLTALDPTRPPLPAVGEKTLDGPPDLESIEAESLSADVLERIARGIVEEPVLLNKPKARPSAPAPSGPRKPPAQIVALGDELEEEVRTSVLEPIAYEAFARSEDGADSSADVFFSENETTRVLDVRGYSNFAREVTKQPVPSAPPPPPPKISFPGGVLPPRKVSSDSQAPFKKPSPPPTFVKPASAPRPSAEFKRAPEPVPPSTAPLDDPDLDFSEVSAVLKAPVVPIVVPPPPPEVQPLRPSTSAPPSARPTTKRPPPPMPAVTPPPPTPISPTSPTPPVHARMTPPAIAPVTQAPPTALAMSGLLGTATPAAAPNPSGPILPAPPGLQGSNALEWSLAQARMSLRAASSDGAPSTSWRPSR
jgi:Type II secretion system (T2SS), protein E, N-terminal domain